MPSCWCCGADVQHCRGHLQRVSPKGEPAQWECCPSCRPPLPLEPCKLYIDGIPTLQPGEYLVTVARGRWGSGYRVLDVRQSPSKPQRRNLLCERVRPVDIPAGPRVYVLRWYSRGKRR